MTSEASLAKALARLQSLCARSEQCSSAVRAKALKALDGDEGAASKALEALVRDGFIDDARFASAFARDKSRFEGWGPAKIRFALLSKGLGEAAIGEALSGLDPAPALGKLRSALSLKLRSLRSDPLARPKLLRLAQSRGFSFSEAAPLVDELLRDQE